MFFLSELEHTLRLPPELLSKPLEQAIKGELETLFLDKVIPDLGLCISVYDLKDIDGGFIFPGDGASTFKVKFRLIMFRPFVGEILSGEIEESDHNGLRLSLGFFQDIKVPAHHLPGPSEFCPEDGRWMWTYEGIDLFIEKEEEVRFKVESVSYPPIPVEQEKDAKPFAPMVIIAAIATERTEEGHMNGPGLGPISWWV